MSNTDPLQRLRPRCCIECGCDARGLPSSSPCPICGSTIPCLILQRRPTWTYPILCLLGAAALLVLAVLPMGAQTTAHYLVGLGFCLILVTALLIGARRTIPRHGVNRIRDVAIVSADHITVLKGLFRLKFTYWLVPGRRRSYDIPWPRCSGCHVRRQTGMMNESNEEGFFPVWWLDISLRKDAPSASGTCSFVSKSRIGEQVISVELQATKEEVQALHEELGRLHLDGQEGNEGNNHTGHSVR